MNRYDGYYYFSDAMINGTLFSIDGMVYYVPMKNFTKLYDSFGYKIYNDLHDFKGTIYRLPHVNTIKGRNCTLWVDETLRMPSTNCLRNMYDWLFRKKREEVPMLGSIQIISNKQNQYKPRNVFTNFFSGHMLSFTEITHVPSFIEINGREICLYYDKKLNTCVYSKIKFRVVDCLNKTIHLKKLQSV